MARKAERFQPKGLEDHISGCRFYSPQHIDAIIEACPKGLPTAQVDVQQADPNGNGLVPCLMDRRAALIEKLEAAAAWYVMSLRFLEPPTPSQQVKQFNAIETAAHRLLMALRLPENGNPDEIPQTILFPLRRRAEALGRRLGGFPHHRPLDWTMEGQTYRDFLGSAQLRDAVEDIKMLRNLAIEAKAIAARKLNQSPKRHKGNEPLTQLVGDLAGIWIEIFEQRIATSWDSTKQRPTGPFLRFLRACLVPLEIEVSDNAIRDRVRTMFLGKGKSSAKKF